MRLALLSRSPISQLARTSGLRLTCRAASPAALSVSHPLATRLFSTSRALEMMILLLSTAHNSLSQRLSLALKARQHDITVELALSPSTIIEAAALCKPDLILCPFLTSLVPKEVYDKYMTLIVHPGAPGDAGPSALDFVLIGDDGTEPDAGALLRKKGSLSEHGRSYWGVTVLQAIEEFDAGPVWAYDQFPVDIDDPALTKSALYRTSVSRAAIASSLSAIERIQAAAGGDPRRISPALAALPTYRSHSVTKGQLFHGGATHHRPLLKAGQRDFDIRVHSAREISRRIRCSDSQPGCLSALFGPSLYLYGGLVESGPRVAIARASPGDVIAVRDEAVCVATAEPAAAIWITHLRRVKRKTDAQLWPKVPAVQCLVELGILSADPAQHPNRLPPLPPNFAKAPHPTFQEIHIEYDTLPGGARVAFVTHDFYNGAMSTAQCQRMAAALDALVSPSSPPISAVILLGGPGYFSNGIHLNVIESSSDPSFESWRNINAINDVAQRLYALSRDRGIVTVAALRGNAAAGGVALAAGCDVVLAAEDVTLNPAYRALGLHGSEYHSVAYPGRCGLEGGRRLLRDMVPLDVQTAIGMGLVDSVVPREGDMRRAVVEILNSTPREEMGRWKRREGVDVSEVALARARCEELGEMGRDFWSARSVRYHERRRDFVRKSKARKTPLRFARHRRVDGEGKVVLDEEERDEFDSVPLFEARERERVESEVIDKVVGAVKGLTQAEAKLETGTVKPLGPVFGCYYNTATA